MDNFIKAYTVKIKNEKGRASGWDISLLYKRT